MAALLLAGCSMFSGKYPVKLSGDKLDLPSQCMVAKVTVAAGGQLQSFKRFDGKYPAGWPDKIVLPPDTYLMVDGHLDAGLLPALKGSNPSPEMEQFRSIKSYQFAAVCKGDPAELTTKLAALTKELGLAGEQHYTDNADLPRDMKALVPSMWSYMAKPPINSTAFPKLWGFVYQVFDDKTIEGWVYFKMGVNLR